MLPVALAHVKLAAEFGFDNLPQGKHFYRNRCQGSAGVNPALTSDGFALGLRPVAPRRPDARRLARLLTNALRSRCSLGAPTRRPPSGARR